MRFAGIWIVPYHAFFVAALGACCPAYSAASKPVQDSSPSLGAVAPGPALMYLGDLEQIAFLFDI